VQHLRFVKKGVELRRVFLRVRVHQFPLSILIPTISQSHLSPIICHHYKLHYHCYKNKTDSFKTAVPKEVMPPIAHHFNCLNPIINFFHVISTTRTFFFFIDMELTDWLVKENVLQSLSRPVTGPKCSSRLRFIEFLDHRHMKVARLSAPNTGRLYPPGDIPVTHIRQGLNHLQCRKD
jgi:hypothetical protein